MNNQLNVINALAATNPVSNTPAGATGSASGAFAQLLDSLALTPVAGAVGATVAVTPQGARITALASMPASLSGEASRPEPSEAVVTTPQPDAVLIAALLGQMQTPYAMPATPPTTSADVPTPPSVTSTPAPVAPPVPSAPVPAAEVRASAAAPTAVPTIARAATGQTLTDALALPVTPDAPLTDAAATGEPLAITRDAAVAAPRSMANFEALTQAGDGDTVNRDAPATAVPITTASARDAEPEAGLAGLISPKPGARDVPTVPGTYAFAAPAATAAVPGKQHLSGQNETLPAAVDDADDTDPHTTSSHAGSVDAAANSQSVRAQAHADFRNALTLQSTHDESQATATIVASPAATSSSTAQPRIAASSEAGDRSVNITPITAGTPAAIVTRSEALPLPAGVAPHLESPEWKPAFANSVKLMVTEGTSVASLQLNPAEFGPIDVRIVMTDRRADISFMVTHPNADTALQSALTELRDQLAQSGIQLGQTSIGAHSQHSHQPNDTPQRKAGADARVTPPVTNAMPARPAGNGNGGKIDIYA